MMRAMVLERLDELLKLIDLPTPEPDERQVLLNPRSRMAGGSVVWKCASSRSSRVPVACSRPATSFQKRWQARRRLRYRQTRSIKFKCGLCVGSQ